MNEQQYRTVIGWFNARPAAKKALRAVSTGAVAAVYLLYLGLLAWLAWHAMWVPLGVTAVVPAAAGVAMTFASVDGFVIIMALLMLEALLAIGLMLRRRQRLLRRR